MSTEAWRDAVFQAERPTAPRGPGTKAQHLAVPCKLGARSQISSPAAVFLLTVVDPRARRSTPRAHGHLLGAASVDSSVRNTLPHLSIRHAADSLRRLGRPLKPFPRRRLPLPGPVSLILYSIALLSARLYGLILLCLLRKTT